MKTLYPSIFNSDELLSTANLIDTTVKANITTDTFINKVEPELKKPIVAMSIVLGRTTDSRYVNILDEKDTIRDTRFIGLRNYCKALIVDEDPLIAEAAQILVAIFKDIGWTLYHEGNAQETTLLDALFGKLATEPASSAIVTAGATSKFNSLKAAQADFVSTFKTKVDYKAQELYPEVRSCRKAISRYLEALVVYIDIMGELQGGIYATTADQVEEIIIEMESIARSRRTRNTPEETQP